MSLDREYFQQIFSVIGTNVAPILAHICLAMVENELHKKYVHDPELKWPVLFKRFIKNKFPTPDTDIELASIFRRV